MTTKIISQMMTTDLMEVGGSSESDLISEKGYICIMQNAQLSLLPTRGNLSEAFTFSSKLLALRG